MKFIAALTLVTGLFCSGLAVAQSAYPHGYPSNPYYGQRDPLAGTTRMRVHNDSSYSIIGIRSSNMQYGNSYRWGSPLSWAGGSIPPHSTIVVDFGDHTGACLFNVEMHTTDGRVHVFGNINTCRTNDIVVPNSGW